MSGKSIQERLFDKRFKVGSFFTIVKKAVRFAVLALCLVSSFERKSIAWYVNVEHLAKTSLALEWKKHSGTIDRHQYESSRPAPLIHMRITRLERKSIAWYVNAEHLAKTSLALEWKKYSGTIDRHQYASSRPAPLIHMRITRP